MWKLLPYGGALVHAFAGTWPVFMAADPAHPVNWLSLGAQVLGPGLAEVALVALIMAACTPKEAVLPLDVRS